jgi:hypothetical protein
MNWFVSRNRLNLFYNICQVDGEQLHLHGRPRPLELRADEPRHHLPPDHLVRHDWLHQEPHPDPVQSGIERYDQVSLTSVDSYIALHTSIIWYYVNISNAHISNAHILNKDILKNGNASIYRTPIYRNEYFLCCSMSRDTRLGTVLIWSRSVAWHGASQK